MNDAINYIAMVLSVVSLIVTTVGFFASLKFYRDGVELQGKANDALTKIEEKTQFIQTQVGGMFERTLDAAIGRKDLLSESFAEITEQLEATKERIIEESLTQIGAASEHERRRITNIIDRQIEQVKQKVETTQESVQEYAEAVDIDVRLPLPHYSLLLTFEGVQYQNAEDVYERQFYGDIRVKKEDVPRLLNSLNRIGILGKAEEGYFLTRRGRQALTYNKNIFARTPQ